MPIFVVSCGRSGTNLVLETLAGNSNLRSSDVIENKLLFRRPKKYDKKYLTKCDTIYCKPYQVDILFELNPDAKIIWTIRDPRDMCMSKIYRGWKKKAADASFDGCLEDLNYMYNIYTYTVNKYPDKIMVVKMEDLIIDIENESKRMCDFIDIPYEEEMKYPYNRMRETKKKYTTLDKGQIGLWERWSEVYDGFFLSIEIDIVKLFEEVNYLILLFNYD